jgi:cytochrome c-type biogenesis protein
LGHIWSVFNLYTLAIVAGVASFFSPCAFPLLPTYFSFYHLGEQAQSPTGVGVHRILQGGVAAALGVIPK